jgi:hypothetical protein
MAITYEMKWELHIFGFVIPAQRRWEMSEALQQIEFHADAVLLANALQMSVPDVIDALCKARIWVRRAEERDHKLMLMSWAYATSIEKWAKSE